MTPTETTAAGGAAQTRRLGKLCSKEEDVRAFESNARTYGKTF